LAPTAGQVVGHLTGHQALGNTIGQVVGHVAPLLPFSAYPVASAPDFAAQGVFGNLIGKLAPTAGQVVGHLTGHQALGNTLGQVVGHVAPFLPFSAYPVASAPDFAAQGVFGNLIGKLAPTAGQLVGQLTGHQALGNAVGQVVTQVAPLLPFSAYPQA
ncbi:hypothetical protein, partial [Zoogloea sp.]|uniref:hypothetical protein n=1 Tax=Zoogloea sp. TaxID=49181 RepID=UPI0035AEC17A